MSNRMTIQQVANELGVSTKTLRRWEEGKYLVPERDPDTNIRLYHPYLIGYWKRVLDLDRALKNHLKLLDGLRRELDKHLPRKQLDETTFPALDVEAFSTAHDAMQEWEKEYKRLFDEIMKYPNIILKATNEEYDEKETEK